MYQEFEYVFGNCITHWFQPIYQLNNSNIMGYEALMRDASQPHTSPVDIFKEADKIGLRNTLDRISIKSATELFADESNLLFLNVFPSTLLEENFLSWWDENISYSKPVVLELLENEPINNWEALKEITKNLQARGIRIAADDMGGGYSFFQQWIELTPEYIKLDRYFARNLSISSQKQKTVMSLIDLFSDTTKIIIEGIETKEDLCAAELLGILYAQGFLFGKPSPKEDIF